MYPLSRRGDQEHSRLGPRRIIQGAVALAGPDRDRIRRLKRLYLSSDLDRLIKRDQGAYAEVTLELTGLEPAELAKTFARLHEQYAEADLSLDEIARETGHSRSDILAALKGCRGAWTPSLLA